jgi:hypothetical protein
VKIFLYGILAVLLSSCATVQEYQPLKAGEHQIFLLNQSALNSVKPGMSEQDVHRIMGQEIVIGYSADSGQSSQYKPLTIPNPYKTKEIQTPSGTYNVEYYVTAVRQADGIITDDELVPLVFKNGVLQKNGDTHLFPADLQKTPS